MKKSNKLLLGGFLAALLMVTALHITLYAKYKGGNYTVSDADGFRAPAMQLYPNILFVSVENMYGTRVEFSDVAGVEKTDANGFEFLRRGDTLVIKRKVGEMRNYDPFSIHVPYNASLTAVRSSLVFSAGKKTAPGSQIINLKESEATFSVTGKPQRFGHLTINAADQSSVVLTGKTMVDRLDLQLWSSSLESAEGDVGQLSVTTDSASRISLQAKQLAKAAITLRPQN